MTRTLNQRLGLAARSGVTVVDCEWLSSIHGKDRWFDPRYWHLAKQAVSLTAVPGLARHTVAVLAAELGLMRKCIVLDLDNTLWGGIIGEDGLAGIRLGEGAQGEAYTSFQEYLLRLRERGLLLAVASKNNEADAREPFLKHPGMRIRLDDVAAFEASWDPKPDQLKRIASALNIGIDALVFVDDNPIEREAMRRLMPEVDVVQLPDDPEYIRAVSIAAPWSLPHSPSRIGNERAIQRPGRTQPARATAASLDDSHQPPRSGRQAVRRAQPRLLNWSTRRTSSTHHPPPPLSALRASPATPPVCISGCVRDACGPGLVLIIASPMMCWRSTLVDELSSDRADRQQAMVAELAARAARLGCRNCAEPTLRPPRTRWSRLV
jgi:HAD superfamily phosphatase (TIGR01681 family)